MVLNQQSASETILVTWQSINSRSGDCSDILSKDSQVFYSVGPDIARTKRYPTRDCLQFLLFYSLG
jgi:hypothetical protein